MSRYTRCAATGHPESEASLLEPSWQYGMGVGKRWTIIKSAYGQTSEVSGANSRNQGGEPAPETTASQRPLKSHHPRRPPDYARGGMQLAPSHGAPGGEARA